VALLIGLGPAARADRRGHHRNRVNLVRASIQDDQGKGEMKPTGEGKGEEKSVKGEEVYTHTDYSESSLESHWYQPLCDYPWTRKYIQSREDRMAPHPSLEFYCVPVTTHLYYPELYPDSGHAGMAYHVEYWP
jgi:hypothetical protein